MSKSVDDWFDFVEEYYSKSTAPLSWTLIGGGQITSMRCAGFPSAMTTLSKREWNKIVGGNNVPRRNLLGRLHQQEVKNEPSREN